MQVLALVLLDVYDLPAVQQVAVEEFDAFGDGNVLGCHQVRRALLLRGVDVDLDVAGEDLAEGRQQGAVLVLVVLRGDQVQQFIDAHYDADGGDFVQPEVVDQVAVAAVIGQHDRLAEFVQQDGAVQEIPFVQFGARLQVVQRQLRQQEAFAGVDALAGAELLVTGA